MEDVSAVSVEQVMADDATGGDAEPATADDLGVTIEKKLTSEVTETVTVTGMFNPATAVYGLWSSVV